MQTEIIYGIFILLSGHFIVKETYLSKDAKHSLELYLIIHMFTGLILGFRPANERWCYFVTTSLIGWAHT